MLTIRLFLKVKRVFTSRVVSGASEMVMAEAVSGAAARTAGKEALAAEAFAVALRRLPSAVADNAGYDSADLIARLRAHHAQGDHTMGLGNLILLLLLHATST